MFDQLSRINTPPAPFSRGTTAELWADPHVSEQMLRWHLDPEVDAASRTHRFIDRSTAWLAETFDLAPGRSVVDLGCGPGLYTTRLARTGAQVHGVDLSERSVAHARQVAADEGLQVTHTVADYLSWVPPGRHDLVLMIMCDFSVLGPDDRSVLLANMERMLRPGGAFVLDVASEAAFAAKEPTASYAPDLMDGFWSAEPYFGFVNTFVYPAERVTVDQYTIVEAERTRQVLTWLQHYSPDTLGAVLEDAGFDVVRRLGSVAGDPYDPAAEEFAVVARRR